MIGRAHLFGTIKSKKSGIWRNKEKDISEITIRDLSSEELNLVDTNKEGTTEKETTFDRKSTRIEGEMTMRIGEEMSTKSMRAGLEETEEDLHLHEGKIGKTSGGKMRVMRREIIPEDSISGRLPEDSLSLTMNLEDIHLRTGTKPHKDTNRLATTLQFSDTNGLVRVMPNSIGSDQYFPLSICYFSEYKQ